MSAGNLVRFPRTQASAPPQARGCIVVDSADWLVIETLVFQAAQRLKQAHAQLMEARCEGGRAQP